MKHLIQFIDLDDLLDEGELDGFFRIATLMDIDEGGYDRLSYVTVRQIQGDNVHSWSYMIGKTDYGDPENMMSDQLDELAELSRQMEEEIGIYISRAWPVRTGIIDIGTRTLMFGVWRWWEEQHQDQESEEKKHTVHDLPSGTEAG